MGLTYRRELGFFFLGPQSWSPRSSGFHVRICGLCEEDKHASEPQRQGNHQHPWPQGCVSASAGKEGGAQGIGEGQLRTLYCTVLLRPTPTTGAFLPRCVLGPIPATSLSLLQGQPPSARHVSTSSGGKVELPAPSEAAEGSRSHVCASLHLLGPWGMYVAPTQPSLHPEARRATEEHWTRSRKG